MKKKKFGFTMAEVLIAIAIIGVIAALVLPVMMKNYNNRIFATKARRAYTAVVDACSHGLSDDQVKYPGDIIDSYCEYIPGKSCTTGENGSVTLKDGTVITLTGWGNNPGGDLEVTIDTNDTKGPNEDGRDKWYTKLTRDCKLADDGSNKTISYLKAHDWKITDDDASGSQISMESKCSFNSSYSVCKQDDGSSKWCSSFDLTNCKVLEGECSRLYGTAFISCKDGSDQKIYFMNNGYRTATLPSNCTQLGSTYTMSCQDENQIKLYDMYNGNSIGTYPNNCTPVGGTSYMSCPDGDNQKIYYNNNLKLTLSKNCQFLGGGFMSCPDGDKLKLYDMSNSSIKSTIPNNNCQYANNEYISCSDGDNQKIYYMLNGSLKLTLPNNCTALTSRFISCPDGDNQIIYSMEYPNNQPITFSKNCSNQQSGLDSLYCFDGTQTKAYSLYSGQENTSYTKAGNCALDSNKFWVCTNGNKKTYYTWAGASEGIEVDADCADPLCSNKQ